MATVKELRKALVEHERVGFRGYSKDYFDSLISKVDWDAVEEKYEEAFKHFQKALKAAENIKEQLENMLDFAERTGKKTEDIDYALSIIEFYLHGFKARVEHGDYFQGPKVARSKIDNFFSSRYKYQLEQDLAIEVFNPKTVFNKRHVNSFVGGLASRGFLKIVKPGCATNRLKRLINDKIGRFKLGEDKLFKDFKELIKILRRQNAFCIVGTNQWIKLLNQFSLKIDYGKLEYDKSSPAVIMNDFWKRLHSFSETVKMSKDVGTYDLADPNNEYSHVDSVSLPGIETPFLHLQRDDGDVYSRYFIGALSSHWSNLKKDDFKKKRNIKPNPITVTAKGDLAEDIVEKGKGEQVRKSTDKEVRMIVPAPPIEENIKNIRESKELPLKGLPLRWEHVKQVTGYDVPELERAGIFDKKETKALKGAGYVSKKFSDLGLLTDAGDYRFSIFTDPDYIKGKLKNYAKELQVGRVEYDNSGKPKMDTLKTDDMALFVIAEL